MDFSVHVNETEREYIWRVGQYVSEGKISWKELAPIINEKWRCSEEEYRDESAYRKPFQSASAYYEDVFSKMISNEYSDNLAEQRRELVKERKKLQTEKTDYNRWLRENARDELIVEKIQEAIEKLEPFETPAYIPNTTIQDKKGMLVIADAHYGIEFELKGLFGETINKYSPEIFEERMWKLLDKTIEIVEQNKLTELTIFDLGDGIDGLIRVSSQMMKLRYGVIDSTMKYAEFISKWLNELSKHVSIKFQMVKDSNHTQMRILGCPKGAFPEENMNKVMLAFIKERTKTNPNIRIIENPTGYAYANICGYNMLAIHGEVKNLGVAVNEFSRTYDTKINYMIAGHFHHAKSEEMGVDCEAINVRSIIGIDSYGLSLNKTSVAGASLLIFESGLGKTCEYSIKLN